VGPAAHYSPGRRKFDGIIARPSVESFGGSGRTALAETVLVSINLDQLIFD
jgi:hypothetical protein